MSELDNRPPDSGRTIPEDGPPILTGRYRVIRQIGSGGMGEVYLAEDLKLDDKRFAIKTPHAILARNARAVETLKKEAMRAMELAHPHIVTVRSFEHSDDGVFIVMDYVEGQTLEDILAERGTLDEDEILRIFRPIAEALDYAHTRGVIHRDVKPSNIIIAADGTPYIMDFGIAREAKETFTRFTGKEATSGTLPYMSPEQVRGKAPAPAQDVYSLAATMYECLTGHPPFHRGDLHYQIMNEPAETPGGGSMPLVDLIMQGLAKDAGKRPGSCRELVRPKVPAKPKVEPPQAVPPAPRPAPAPPPGPAPKPSESETPVRPVRQPARPPDKPAKDRPRSIVGPVLGVLGLLVVVVVVVVIVVSQSDSGSSSAAHRSSPQPRATQSEKRTPPGPSSGAPRETPSPVTPPRSTSTANPPQPGKDYTVPLGGGVSMELVWIEGGRTFQMGSNDGDSDEKPVHRVTLSEGFWLGETEVTQGEWYAVMKTRPWSGKEYVLSADDAPAVYVDWNDAKSFCTKLSNQTGLTFRLPSEAEWEHACRAGKQTAYSFGNDENDLGRYAWYRGNAWDRNEKYAHKVGTKDPNPWGLYDMHGNVWEWCADWYGEYPSGNVTDPSGPSSGQSRVLRGGSWSGTPRYCRSAYRIRYSPDGTYIFFGFRVCLDE